jgi:hypothetical protein
MPGAPNRLVQAFEQRSCLVHYLAVVASWLEALPWNAEQIASLILAQLLATISSRSMVFHSCSQGFMISS